MDYEERDYFVIGGMSALLRVFPAADSGAV